MPFLLELGLDCAATVSVASENVTVFEVRFVEAAGSATSEGEVAVFLTAFEGEMAAVGAAFECEEVEASAVGYEGVVVASSMSILKLWLSRGNRSRCNCLNGRARHYCIAGHHRC